MEFSCFAMDGKKEVQIPLIDEEGLIVHYLRDTIKDVLKYHKWELPAEMFCENMDIRCDALILKAAGNETGCYQINHFLVCTQANELLVTLKVQKIDFQNLPSEKGETLAFIFVSLTRDEKGQVLQIDRPTRLIFPSARQI